jgi:hypothetical protein
MLGDAITAWLPTRRELVRIIDRWDGPRVQQLCTVGDSCPQLGRRRPSEVRSRVEGIYKTISPCRDGISLLEAAVCDWFRAFAGRLVLLANRSIVRRQAEKAPRSGTIELTLYVDLLQLADALRNSRGVTQQRRGTGWTGTGWKRSVVTVAIGGDSAFRPVAGFPASLSALPESETVESSTRRWAPSLPSGCDNTPATRPRRMDRR